MKQGTKVNYEYNNPIDETPVKLFSFFSGVGFLDLGFENAGFDIAFVNECDERFLQSYKYARRNDQHVPQYGYSNEDNRMIRKNVMNDFLFLSDEKVIEAEESLFNKMRDVCSEVNEYLQEQE